MNSLTIAALIAAATLAGCSDLEKKEMEGCIARQEKYRSTAGAQAFCGCVAERARTPDGNSARDAAECSAMAGGLK